MFHLIILVVVQPYIRLSDNIRSLAMCCTEIVIVVASSFAGTDRHVSVLVHPFLHVAHAQVTRKRLT